VKIASKIPSKISNFFAKIFVIDYHEDNLPQEIIFENNEILKNLEKNKSAQLFNSN